jgi:hypothetical protein
VYFISYRDNLDDRCFGRALFRARIDAAVRRNMKSRHEGYNKK